MNITVNGKALEHNIGDRYWYIGFGKDGWTPKVCKSKDSIEKIEMTKDGVAYFASDGFRMSEKAMEATTTFWTKEEAEKWFSENIPEQLAFKPNEEFFFVLEKPYEVVIEIVRMSKTDGLYINGDELLYTAERISDGYSYYFDAEDLGTKLFRTYEEADKKRKELE